LLQTLQLQSRRNTVQNDILRQYNLFPIRLLSCQSCPLFVWGRIKRQNNVHNMTQRTKENVPRASPSMWSLLSVSMCISIREAHLVIYVIYFIRGKDRYHAYVISDIWCRPYNYSHVETPYKMISSVNIICFQSDYYHVILNCRHHSFYYQDGSDLRICLSLLKIILFLFIVLFCLLTNITLNLVSNFLFYFFTFSCQ
jgi:hypothetical protein